MQHNYFSEAIILPFVEPECSLPCSQRPGTGPSPDQAPSRVIFLKSILHPMFPLIYSHTYNFPIVPFRSSFPTNNVSISYLSISEALCTVS